MRGPLFQAKVSLLVAAKRARLLLDWRPTILPMVESNGEPDFSATGLGVSFVNGPGQVQPGRDFECSFHILAWPDPLCDRIAAGKHFAVTEGKTVVGVGKVISVHQVDDA